MPESANLSHTYVNGTVALSDVSLSYHGDRNRDDTVGGVTAS